MRLVRYDHVYCKIYVVVLTALNNRSKVESHRALRGTESLTLVWMSGSYSVSSIPHFEFDGLLPLQGVLGQNNLRRQHKQQRVNCGVCM